MASLFDGVAWLLCPTAYSLCMVLKEWSAAFFAAIFALGCLDTASGLLWYCRLSFEQPWSGVRRPARVCLAERDPTWSARADDQDLG